MPIANGGSICDLNQLSDGSLNQTSHALACQVDRKWLQATDDLAEFGSFQQLAKSHSVRLLWIFDEEYENVKAWVANRHLVGWIITDHGTRIHDQEHDTEVGRSRRSAAHLQDAINECLENEAIPANRLVLAGAPHQLDDLWRSQVRKILLSDTCRNVARQLFDGTRSMNARDREYLSGHPRLAGVEDGCRWYELFPPSDARREPFDLGAIPVSSERTSFRVWAPRRRSIAVRGVGEHAVHATLQRHANGYHTGEVLGIGPGDNYLLEINGERRRPDPTSRYQPQGVHGPSQVVAEGQFPWTDKGWRGVPKSDLVIYELHIGAFTKAGTFQAASGRLEELVELGITAVELLPVAQCPGRRNWGYDGVNLFAPRNTYGTPNDFRAFVDTCHDAGIAVILDVVYNHLGPEGNYLSDFGPYFSKRHHTPWGDSFAYDGRHHAAVGDFMRANVRHWFTNYHIDGLRLDAVHFMFDDRETTILDLIREDVTALQDQQQRPLHLIAEANVYDAKLVTGSKLNPPYDAIWCDDMMHSIYTLGVENLSLTHRTYRGATDLAEVLEAGYLYTGPEIARATPTTRAALHADGDQHYLSSLVVALQTHDSVGNHPHGKRIHELTSPAFQQAAAALVLLYPAIPMIFMGEERATSSRFPFFVDFEDAGLNAQVDRGRANEYPQHQWEGAIRPSSPQAFETANDELAASDAPEMRPWYRELIAIRNRWRQRGLVRPETLHVECDVPASVFSFHYRGEDGSQVHVWAQLQAHHAVPPPLSDHRPLLDSWKETSHPQSTTRINRAVVWETRPST